MVSGKKSQDYLSVPRDSTLWRRTSPTNPTLIPLTRQFGYDALDRVTLARDPLGNEALTFQFTLALGQVVDAATSNPGSVPQISTNDPGDFVAGNFENPLLSSGIRFTDDIFAVTESAVSLTKGAGELGEAAANGSLSTFGGLLQVADFGFGVAGAVSDVETLSQGIASLGSQSVPTGGGFSPAGGGFILFPSRPNLNAAERVYSK